MSTLDGPLQLRSGTADDVEEGPTAFERLVGHPLVRAFEQAAFWTAVALPFLYVPLLVGGVSTSSEFVALVALLGLHFVTLYLGQDYEPN